MYGKPGARTMGILGQYSLEAIGPVMDDFVRRYEAANGQRGSIPSFYIIYGTCWPEGEIGILQDRVVKEYIEYAAERGVITSYSIHYMKLYDSCMWVCSPIASMGHPRSKSSRIRRA